MPAGKIVRVGHRRHNTFLALRSKGRPRGRIHRVRGRRTVRRARGLTPLTIPMKIGYTYDKTGDTSSVINFDDDVGMHKAPPAWFNRYEPIFQWVRINKVHIEITCGYNIGQPAVGTPPALFQLWYKKAQETAESVPGDITEWLNMQSAKRQIFSGKRNSVDLYFTPAFESRSQPLNTANETLKLLYKQWQTIQTTAAKMTPHIGIIGQIHALDGGSIPTAVVFKVNVTMYCELKGVKQL